MSTSAMEIPVTNSAPFATFGSAPTSQLATPVTLPAQIATPAIPTQSTAPSLPTPVSQPPAYASQTGVALKVAGPVSSVPVSTATASTVSSPDVKYGDSPYAALYPVVGAPAVSQYATAKVASAVATSAITPATKQVVPQVVKKTTTTAKNEEKETEVVGKDGKVLPKAKNDSKEEKAKVEEKAREKVVEKVLPELENKDLSKLDTKKLYGLPKGEIVELEEEQKKSASAHEGSISIPSGATKDSGSIQAALTNLLKGIDTAVPGDKKSPAQPWFEITVHLSKDTKNGK